MTQTRYRIEGFLQDLAALLRNRQGLNRTRGAAGPQEGVDLQDLYTWVSDIEKKAYDPLTGSVVVIGGLAIRILFAMRGGGRLRRVWIETSCS